MAVIILNLILFMRCCNRHLRFSPNEAFIEFSLFPMVIKLTQFRRCGMTTNCSIANAHVNSRQYSR